jgi:hypothetical protein
MTELFRERSAETPRCNAALRRCLLWQCVSLAHFPGSSPAQLGSASNVIPETKTRKLCIQGLRDSDVLEVLPSFFTPHPARRKQHTSA